MAMKGKIAHRRDCAVLPPEIDMFHVEPLARARASEADRCLVWMRRRTAA
jgi:hypothetical protein